MQGVVNIEDLRKLAKKRLPKIAYDFIEGGTDDEILAWAHARGTPRTDEECHIWNRFILKLGWRDERSAVLPQRIRDAGLVGKPIETIADHIEFDEGRDPVASRAWENV